MPQEEKQRSYFQNVISVIGGILSVTFFSAFLVLFALEFINKDSNPYLGIITYIVIPFFLFISLTLIPTGVWWERKARAKRGYVRRFPQIDFNNPTHQRWAYTTIGVVIAFLIFTMVGVYRAYEFSESVTFCGKTCHEVMEPEYTAYHNSPHARVACVECHVGHGADSYIRSKIRGTYQVYSVIAKKYPRPVETPIANLRPAQETCERCHWPQQFFGAIEQDKQYFLSDESNSPWKTRMLMHVGGGMPPYGKKEGIHWHMNINNKVKYIATDKDRQTIPWVSTIGPDGKEEIFVDTSSGYSADNPPQGELRIMDCIDCHNRPSHIFKSPVEAVDEALSYGAIDSSLPYIKKESIKVLLGKYTSHEEAATKISDHLHKFYTKKYPELAASKAAEIEHSIQSVLRIYKNNFFPAMNVSWKEYPDNIGHLNFPGCFRCHDNKHETAEGKVLTNDCNLCHTIIAQGPPSNMTTAITGLEFQHPDLDVGEAWKEMNCFECHTGGAD